MTAFVTGFGIITNTLAIIGLLSFVANYSAVRFERTYLGRALMAGAAATLMLAVASITYRISAANGVSYHDQWWTRLMIASAWLVVGMVYFWQVLELRRTQRANR